jgi:hypothetical protein
MKVLANMLNFEGSVVTATEAAVADDAVQLPSRFEEKYNHSMPLLDLSSLQFVFSEARMSHSHRICDSIANQAGTSGRKYERL